MERNGIYRNTAEWNGMDKNGTGIYRNKPEWRRNETERTRMVPEYTGTSWNVTATKRKDTSVRQNKPQKHQNVADLT